jgi:hypothetical protein
MANMTVSEYLEKKEKWKNTHFRIKMGKGFYIVKGKEIPMKEYEANNPAPELSKSNDNNPDKTYIR